MPTNRTVDEIYPDRWLKAVALPNEDMILTISDVNEDLVGPEKEQKLILSFQEVKKGLILNKVNSMVLQEKFGKNPNSWVGRKIAIYATEVSYAGKTTLAIRIRLKGPEQSAASQPPAPLAPQDEVPW